MYMGHDTAWTIIGTKLDQFQFWNQINLQKVVKGTNIISLQTVLDSSQDGQVETGHHNPRKLATAAALLRRPGRAGC